MKIINKLFLLVLLVFFGAFAGYKIMQYEAPKTITPKERVALANDWLKGLNEVYTRTGDKEVSEQLLMVEKHAVLGIPKEGSMNLQRKMEPGDFALIPLVASDVKFSPWDKVFASPSMATYLPAKRALVLKGDKLLSPFYAGAIASHELKHHEINPDRLSKTAMEYCREEVTVHEFSNKLTAEAGGKPYQKLLDARAKEWGVYLNDAKAELPSPKHYLGDMEKIFGPSYSGTEDGIRVTNFEIGALYLAVDTYYTVGDKEEQKASLMYEMYKKNGNELPGEK